jgi:hypothetical protein
MPDPLSTFARELAPTPAQVDRLCDTLDRQRRQQRAPSRGRLIWPALALAAAAVIAVTIRPDDPEVGLRGTYTPPPEQATGVQLRLALDQGGSLSQLSRGQAVGVGDRVFFRVSTESAAPVTVWMEGPSGVEVISRFSTSGPGAVDVPSGDGLQTWRFDQPGSYRFSASTEGAGVCRPATCSSRTVEVR